MLGRYTVTDSGIRFTPRFPFDPGRPYRVVFDATQLSGEAPAAGWRTEVMETTVRLPAADLSATTRVVGVYPSAEIVPENHLRFYVEFSASMGLTGGVDHVRLLDAEQQPVEDAFLPLDVAMWNDDRTRYTLLFDPGRVKRGILPNEQMGRPLVAGRRYELVIHDAWLDGQGVPLAEPYRHSFLVGPALELAIDPTQWALDTPAAGTRDALTVSFDRALDYALLHRALFVSPPGGGALAGNVAVGPGETTWRFVPDDPWAAAEHLLIARPVLEDPAGNRVGRAFEVGTEGSSPSGADRPSSIPFRPRSQS